MGGKGLKGSFQMKQHPVGFMGSADDVAFNTGPGIYYNTWY